jgi:hypothetical protein
MNKKINRYVMAQQQCLASQATLIPEPLRGSATRQQLAQAKVKPVSPVAMMVDMYRSNRWEIPIWILLAVSASVLVAISFKI